MKTNLTPFKKLTLTRNLFVSEGLGKYIQGKSISETIIV